MTPSGRPGPKPKRLYVRLVRIGDAQREDLPAPRVLRAYLDGLDRVGRLVAHGALTDPTGDLLLLRATDREEAIRILRLDPFRAIAEVAYDLLEWDPALVGSGINLEPPPGRGAGRLTALQRIAVVVRDQDRALAWYRDTLGLAVREHDADTRFVELSLGKGAAALSLVEPRPEWGEPYYAETVARIGRATGIVFQTDSVFALEQRLRGSGAGVTQAPERQPWGGVTIRFTDPEGNEFLAFQTADDPRAGAALGAPRAATHGVHWRRRSSRPKPL